MSELRAEWAFHKAHPEMFVMWLAYILSILEASK